MIESAGSHFSKRAEKYNRSSKWVHDEVLIDKIFLAADAGPGARVLDIAVGTGKIAGAFRGTVGFIVGIDICLDMAEQAQKNTDARPGLGN